MSSLSVLTVHMLRTHILLCRSDRSLLHYGNISENRENKEVKMVRRLKH